MIVAQRLAQREIAWRELDTLLVQLANRRKLSAEEVLRLGELYRSTCTDLMLAEDHDLPRETVAHLQALVARAHNLVYRASGFQFRDLGRALFYSAPAAAAPRSRSAPGRTRLLGSVSLLGRTLGRAPRFRPADLERSSSSRASITCTLSR